MAKKSPSPPYVVKLFEWRFEREQRPDTDLIEFMREMLDEHLSKGQVHTCFVNRSNVYPLI